MNAQQVAHELGVTERTVRRWISSGKLGAVKVGRAFEIDLEAARAVHGGVTSGTFQDALADALHLLRSFGHEADALEIEQRYGFVYVEPRPRVRAA